MLSERAVRERARRLDPAMRTALVASIGFVPTVLAIKAITAVQRPLTTVVIGGVVSTILLPLFVLPAICARFDRPADTHAVTVAVILLSREGRTAS